jgi:hypothetical protein
VSRIGGRPSQIGLVDGGTGRISNIISDNRADSLVE